MQVPPRKKPQHAFKVGCLEACAENALQAAGVCIYVLASQQACVQAWAAPKYNVRKLPRQTFYQLGSVLETFPCWTGIFHKA